MTRVLVAAWIGSGNVGDELILRATLRLLAEHDVDVLVPSIDPDATAADHGVRSIHHLDLVRNGRAATTADLVVFGGGGLVQDATSPWSPYYQASRPLLARLAQVPLVGLGLGAQPLRLPTSRAILRSALRGASEVAARDVPSAEALRQLGVPRVTTTADLALTLPPPPRAATDDGPLVACLRSQPHRSTVVPSRWRRRGSDDDATARALGEALTETAARLGAPVRLVAMEPRRDTPFSERVAGHLRADVEVVAPSLDDVLATVAQARLVVSTRYHGAIAAAISGRPTVLFGYAPKVRALAADLGSRARLLDHEPGAIAALPDQAIELLATTPAAESAPRRLLDRAGENARVLTTALSRAAAARSRSGR